MNSLQRYAVVGALLEKMESAGSWCGETHLQKATYILQEVFLVDTGFDFILYKYGPFSFDLRDELTRMRADGLLELCARWPYGPAYFATSETSRLVRRFPKTLGRWRKQIRQAAKLTGKKDVGELEKLATSLYLRINKPKSSLEKSVRMMTDLKPHIPLAEAREALEEASRVLQKAGTLN